jgi:hemerythrin
MEAWSAALEVGFPEMDDAHQALYRDIAAIDAAAARGDQAGAQAALDGLFERSGDHFAAEERLMTESAYAALAEHRGAHAAFLEDLHKLRKELGARGLSPLFRLWFGSRIAGWLRYHITTADVAFYQRYRAFLDGRAAGR